jgi:P pilus assembly chaperone PapD
VPVPCASMYWMVAAEIPATDSASDTTPACQSTLGAVYPIFAEPSLLTADPRTTA